MSYKCNCQFCDKEMAAENLATMVGGYITCGNLHCQRKAQENIKQTIREEAARVEHNSRMVVFSTLNPEDESTWRVADKKSLPEALRNVDIMGQMKAFGHMLFEEDTKLYYCVKTSLEVINQVKEKLAEASNHE